jgi:hypothetical protein
VRTVLISVGCAAAILGVVIVTGTSSGETQEQVPPSQNSVVEARPFAGANWS